MTPVWLLKKEGVGGWRVAVARRCDGVEGIRKAEKGQHEVKGDRVPGGFARGLSAADR